MGDLDRLHPLSHFLSHAWSDGEDTPTDWYEGRCPKTGRWLRLPRTVLAEAIAQGLMAQIQPSLLASQGKMYGVLLVQTPTGEKAVLKAFSGLLGGQQEVPGWVPPIPGRQRVAAPEAATLAALEVAKQKILALQQRPEPAQYAALVQEFAERLQALGDIHRQRKQARQAQRAELTQQFTGTDLARAIADLEAESRRDGRERRHLKAERDAVLHPLKQQVEAIATELSALKQHRRQFSRQLQTQMHEAYWLTNFWGESSTLDQLAPGSGLPTGTGDCCAPKLLHFAATHHLIPLAMAEFWWGPSQGDKRSGQFYGACQERCQPIMGFLLSGLGQLSGYSGSFASAEPCRTEIAAPEPLSILYADPWFLAVNKPPGLLSVPGRYRHTQDSVLTRLRHSLGQGADLLPVHRLDQDTSGILLLARGPEALRRLTAQFQQRQVQKTYEAILDGIVEAPDGCIDLPLWGDPTCRPRQRANWQRGKPSQTHFQVMDRANGLTRIEFFPITGRTHQIRVHAADPQGLGVPILGDRLYHPQPRGDRLYLHARALSFRHPDTGQNIMLTLETPFGIAHPQR